MYTYHINYNYISRYMKEDISGLFGKISRKDQGESHNAAIASDYLSELYQVECVLSVESVCSL